MIEYDGPTHFEPIYGQEKFRKIKIRDKLKDTFCENEGYHLLRIPYFEQDYMEFTITDFIYRLIE